MDHAVNELPQTDFWHFDESEKDTVNEESPKDYIIVKKDTVYITESDARFKDGAKGLFNYIGSNLVHPGTARDSLNSRQVEVVFTIDKESKTSNI